MARREGPAGPAGSLPEQGYPDLEPATIFKRRRRRK